MYFGGLGGGTPSHYFSKLQESLSNSEPCYKRVSQSILCDSFLLSLVPVGGQMVETAPLNGKCYCLTHMESYNMECYESGMGVAKRVYVALCDG